MPRPAIRKVSIWKQVHDTDCLKRTYKDGHHRSAARPPIKTSLIGCCIGLQSQRTLLTDSQTQDTNNRQNDG